jgi:hypothetical protein
VKKSTKGFFARRNQAAHTIQRHYRRHKGGAAAVAAAAALKVDDDTHLLAAAAGGAPSARPPKPVRGEKRGGPCTHSPRVSVCSVTQGDSVAAKLL